ncbi:MAG TPA: hypothetical protein DEP05_09295 [Betaproteobacteria bacterium]|nr:hypothetical protein [Betaproteobacteria bacterium]
MNPRKVRVLIADDEAHIRQLIRFILSSLGAEVVAEAADGETAVRLYQEHKPDMVLLDINMPKLDGMEALKRIVAINNKTLVIMLTAQNALDVVRQCLDHGARNFILKSNSAEELDKIIRETWQEYVEEIRGGEGAHGM